uniref:RING-type E3 ubiquitin transferase n=1 Tax=Sorghum propinquum TaxID=132711 RepID=I6M4X8_SORPR|nr:ring-H2 zinc finger protein [Sorghum propinquum]
MFPGSVSNSGGQQQLAISNGVLLAAVIFLFMVVVFVFLLYLYAKRYLGANPLLAPTSPSSRFLFVAASPLPQRGLPASVLRSLPVTVYAAAGAGYPNDKEKADALECAVCLSEVADGEKVRTLPKCGHGFHVECIDMWFHSHDTCPLCRAPVGGAGAGELDALPREEPSGASLEFPVFPTNVLFWGTNDEVTNAGLATPPPPPPHPIASASAAASASSSASSGRRKENQLVIDIPTRPVALNTPPMNSPLPASRMPGTADDMRSPVSARLRSLRRLLSRGKQAVVGTSSYSPSPRGGAGGDIEQGIAGADAARAPKTPKTPPSSAN